MLFDKPKTSSQAGFSYLALLMVMMLSSIGMAAVGSVWSFEAQRQKERDLLFIGQSYQAAFERYYNSVPSAKAYPKSIDDLLHDERTGKLKRHLRQEYADPMTNTGEWGVIKQGAFIVGVYSQSNKDVINKGLFNKLSPTGDVLRYSDLKFGLSLATNADNQSKTSASTNDALLHNNTASDNFQNQEDALTSNETPSPSGANQATSKIHPSVLERLNKHNLWLEEQLRKLREDHLQKSGR